MEYALHLAILVSLFAIFAVSLDLITGYAGLVSVAHSAFYGIGAYATAVLTTSYDVNFFLALLAGVLLAAVTAFLVGLVFSKFAGDYYVLGTLGFTFIVFTIFLNWQSVTGGPLGIPGIPRPEIFGYQFVDSVSFLLLSLAFLAAFYFISRGIVSSSFGRILKAIREDERAIEVFGYRALFFKLTVFVISAAMAAAGGALLASYLSFIDPRAFAIGASVFILAMVILGGLGSLRGPVLGALILVLLPEMLRFLGLPSDIAAQMRQAIYGVLLVALMLYRPQGLLGRYRL